MFWSGSLEAVSGLPEDVVVRALHESVRREFVRSSRPSSFIGQQEFAFNHMLVQEVAYGQIPRAARVDKHIAAARWLRAVAVSRVFEFAELLAHHYDRALVNARSTDPQRGLLQPGAGNGVGVDGGRRPGQAARPRPGDRVVPPSPRRAPTRRSPERPRALLEAAECAEQAGRLQEAERDFDLAISELRASGDRAALGEALARGAQSVLRFGKAARDLLEEAVAILEGEEPGPELARAYTRMAGHLYVAGDNTGSISWADKALSIADEVGLDDEATSPCSTGVRRGARPGTGRGSTISARRSAGGWTSVWVRRSRPPTTTSRTSCGSGRGHVRPTGCGTRWPSSAAREGSRCS